VTCSITFRHLSYFKDEPIDDKHGKVASNDGVKSYHASMQSRHVRITLDPHWQPQIVYEDLTIVFLSIINASNESASEMGTAGVVEFFQPLTSNETFRLVLFDLYSQRLFLLAVLPLLESQSLM